MFNGVLQLKDMENKIILNKQETLSKKSSTDCSDHSKVQSSTVTKILLETHTLEKIAEKP